MTKSYSFILVTVPGFSISSDITKLVQSTDGSTVVDFYTMDMEELSIIAKHRVLPRPTLLVMSGTKVIGRFVDKMPSASKITEFLLSKEE